MTTIFIAILLLCDIFTLFIFIDVILSWLTVFGGKVRLPFISDILDPLYELIKKYIPVSFGPFLFTPVILLFCIYFIKGLVIAADPDIMTQYHNLLNIF